MRKRKFALLVIDMQNDFILAGSTIRVSSISKNLAKFAKFLEKIRLTKVLVIYTRHIYDGKPNPAEQDLFPNIVRTTLQKDSFGAEIHNIIAPEKADRIIDKKRYDAFHGTKLNQILKKMRVTDIIISGTMTDVCCLCTAHTAMMNDFRVIFLEDLTFTSDKNSHKWTLSNIRSNFGKVTSSEKLLRILNNNKKQLKK